MKTPALLLALAAATPPAHAADCFGPGAAAMRAQRWHTAAAAFRDALGDPACAADAEPLRYNLAVARLQSARAGDDPGGLAACEAEAIFREIIARSADADLVTAARADIADARARCAPPPPPTIAAAAPGGDRALAWALTASAATALAAGGLLLGLALDADAERAAAKDDFINATTVIDQARAEAAFEPARDRTTRYGLAAYTTLGVGAGLAIGALLTWLATPDGAVQVTPGGAVIMQRF